MWRESVPVLRVKPIQQNLSTRPKATSPTFTGPSAASSTLQKAVPSSKGSQQQNIGRLTKTQRLGLLSVHVHNNRESIYLEKYYAWFQPLHLQKDLPFCVHRTVGECLRNQQMKCIFVLFLLLLDEERVGKTLLEVELVNLSLITMLQKSLEDQGGAFTNLK